MFSDSTKITIRKEISLSFLNLWPIESRPHVAALDSGKLHSTTCRVACDIHSCSEPPAADIMH
jgi:hypothetical protein